LQFTEAKIGRVFILRLHDGDHLPEVLEKFAEEHYIQSALCFLVGGVRGKSRVVVGPRDEEALPPEPVVTLLSGASEVAGLGTIFVNEKNKPKLHMHASFGRGKKTITGCVRMGVDIWHIGEVVILELGNGETKRAVDAKTGFEFLEVG